MNGVKKIKSFGLFLGLALIVVGILLFAYPEKVVEVTAVVLGAVLVAYSVVKAITTIARWNYEDPEKGKKSTFAKVVNLIVDVFLLAIAVYLFINEDATVATIGVVIGILAIISAFDRFTMVVRRIKLHVRWIPTLIFGIIHLAFGITMIYSAISVFSLVVMLAGAYLIVAGIMIVLSTCYFFDFD